jgi:hypothetical protein
LIIFDEASQVRPFDAIGAVYRRVQIVVAGDQKQLPPTSFFDRLVSDDDSDTYDEDDDMPSRLSDFESVLDVCCSMGMPRKRLRWHYRSRREALITFSNRHFYANELATFPSVFDADSKTAVQLHFVTNGEWRPGRVGGDNPAEARETALLVFRLLEQYPDQSLGVITFNQRQQFAVLDELERLRRDRPELEESFQEDRDEPFFVKNLENVQGDERDRMVIGVGYGYDEKGKFAMRFGPLNVQGGERRLNVAVTRAKHGWTICRIWSTDWVRNPEVQIRRVAEAYEKAMMAATCEIPRTKGRSGAGEEKPVLRVRTADGDDNGATYFFSSIEDVPVHLLSTVILRVLRRYGQTTDEELIRVVSRELGFQRVGKRIAARIGKRIADLIAARTVRRADGDRLCVS